MAYTRVAINAKLMQLQEDYNHTWEVYVLTNLLQSQILIITCISIMIYTSISFPYIRG